MMKKIRTKNPSVPKPMVAGSGTAHLRAALADKEVKTADVEQAKQAIKVRPSCIDAVNRFGKKTGNK
jgi:hypothetical protein